MNIDAPARMKLHWSPRSPYVRKVMICAYETGTVDRLECVRSTVSMTSPNPDVMRDNPLGKIPTLITDQGALFDSAVICEYLDQLHSGPRLFPLQSQARFKALRWQALGDGMLDVEILWRNELLRPVAHRSAQWLSGFELKLHNALDLIDRESDELSQAPFGIGHITLGCALGYLDFRFADLDWRAGHAPASAWCARFHQRDSVQHTLPRDG